MNSQRAYSEKATLDLAELAPASARLHDLKQGYSPCRMSTTISELPDLKHILAATLSGIDIAAARDFASLQGANVGVLGNQASTDKAGRPTG